MALIPKDPLEWLNLFRQQMTVIFKHLSQVEEQKLASGPEFSPSLDISESADRFMVEVDLPGATTERLSVTLCCSLLVIAGEKRQEATTREVNLYCLERQYGHFCRTVEVPPGFALDQARASYRRGVLTVSFPRLPATAPMVREVAIEQGEY